MAKTGSVALNSAMSRRKGDSIPMREDTPRPAEVSTIAEDHVTGVIRVPAEQVHWPYQCILDRRVKNGRVEYLVKWDHTWEDGDSLSNLDQAVREYEDGQGLLDGSSVNSHSIGRTDFSRPLSVDDAVVTEKAFADAVSKNRAKILRYEHQTTESKGIND